MASNSSYYLPSHILLIAFCDNQELRVYRLWAIRTPVYLAHRMKLLVFIGIKINLLQKMYGIEMIIK